MGLHHTRGIVLHQLKYSETSVIVKVYTERFGLLTYLIKGVRKRKHSVSPALLQHLTLLDMVVYHRENADIQHARELRAAFPFATIPFDPVKNAIAIFINEMIYRSLREHEQNPELFEFLFTTILMLDEAREAYTDFHLWFCVHFTKYLGFFPAAGNEEENIFDMMEGVFVRKAPVHLHYLPAGQGLLLRRLMKARFTDLQDLHVGNAQRREMVRNIITYYQLHLQGFGNVNSHEVLCAVME